MSPFFLQVLNIQRDVIPNLGNFQPMCFGCRFRSWLKSFALSPPLCISISCRIIGQIPFSLELLFSSLLRRNETSQFGGRGENVSICARIQCRDYRTFTLFDAGFCVPNLAKKPQSSGLISNWRMAKQYFIFVGLLAMRAALYT